MRVSERNRRLSLPPLEEVDLSGPFWFRLSLSIYRPAHRLDSRLLSRCSPIGARVVVMKLA